MATALSSLGMTLALKSKEVRDEIDAARSEERSKWLGKLENDLIVRMTILADDGDVCLERERDKLLNAILQDSPPRWACEDLFTAIEPMCAKLGLLYRVEMSHTSDCAHDEPPCTQFITIALPDVPQ